MFSTSCLVSVDVSAICLVLASIDVVSIFFLFLFWISPFAKLIIDWPLLFLPVNQPNKLSFLVGSNSFANLSPILCFAFWTKSGFISK